MTGPVVVPIPDHAIARWVDPNGSRRLLVADLHLGLGITRGRGVGLATAHAQQMLRELTEVAAEENARAVVVAGDVKHPITNAPPPVHHLVFDFFAELLKERLRIDVVRGNHDVRLDPALPREVRLHPAGGLRRGSVGVVHGHTMPDARLAVAETLVMGHLHPGFRLAGPQGKDGGKRRCWVRGVYPDGSRPEVPWARRARTREILVMPAFHPVAGIESLNRTAPSRGRSFLVRRFLAPAKCRAYLLDGTDLGDVLREVAPRVPRGSSRARPSS
ncbi:MAG: metallophosphoesterase family protein [Thermoplasmata archaeon]|nr:metallophosphoesterase family protein [Thermoplasmata archaeon]